MLLFLHWLQCCRVTLFVQVASSSTINAWIVCALYRIWEYLVELVSTTRTTIVITTHYIEEARQANLVSD